MLCPSGVVWMESAFDTDLMTESGVSESRAEVAMTKRTLGAQPVSRGISFLMTGASPRLVGGDNFKGDPRRGLLLMPLFLKGGCSLSSLKADVSDGVEGAGTCSGTGGMTAGSAGA